MRCSLSAKSLKEALSLALRGARGYDKKQIYNHARIEAGAGLLTITVFDDAWYQVELTATVDEPGVIFVPHRLLKGVLNKAKGQATLESGRATIDGATYDLASPVTDEDWPTHPTIQPGLWVSGQDIQARLKALAASTGELGGIVLQAGATAQLVAVAGHRVASLDLPVIRHGNRLHGDRVALPGNLPLGKPDGPVGVGWDADNLLLELPVKLGAAKSSPTGTQRIWIAKGEMPQGATLNRALELVSKTMINPLVVEVKPLRTALEIAQSYYKAAGSTSSGIRLSYAPPTGLVAETTCDTGAFRSPVPTDSESLAPWDGNWAIPELLTILPKTGQATIDISLQGAGVCLVIRTGGMSHVLMELKLKDRQSLKSGLEPARRAFRVEGGEILLPRTGRRIVPIRPLLEGEIWLSKEELQTLKKEVA